MRQFGNVKVPQAAFLAALKMRKDQEESSEIFNAASFLFTHYRFIKFIFLIYDRVPREKMKKMKKMMVNDIFPSSRNRQGFFSSMNKPIPRLVWLPLKKEHANSYHWDVYQSYR